MTQRSMIRSIPSHRPPVSVEPVAGVEAHAVEPEGSLRSTMLQAMDELVLRRGWDVELARVLVEDQVARGLVYESTTGDQLAEQVEEWCRPFGWAALVSRKYLQYGFDDRVGARRGPKKPFNVSRRAAT